MKELSIELYEAGIAPTGLSIDDAQTALQMYRDSLVKCDCCMHHFPRNKMQKYEPKVFADIPDLSKMLCIDLIGCITRMYQEIG